MVETVEQIRTIEPRWYHPYDPATGVGEFIAEKQVMMFCSGCDSLKEDNMCDGIVDNNDQARYASRRWCGWASVKGLRGEMTVDGFIPWKLATIIPRERQVVLQLL